MIFCHTRRLIPFTVIILDLSPIVDENKYREPWSDMRGEGGERERERSWKTQL